MSVALNNNVKWLQADTR